MDAFLTRFTYVGLVLALLARGMGAPIPEDIPLLTVGFLCARDVCRLAWVLPVAWMSVVAADSIGFFGGRWFGPRLTRSRLFRRLLKPRHVERAERFYHRHGLKALLAARFVPGLRSQLFFVAGTARVRPLKFLMIDAVAAGLSVPVTVLLGSLFPSDRKRIYELLQLGRWILLALILAGLILVLVRYWRRKRNLAAVPE